MTVTSATTTAPTIAVGDVAVLFGLLAALCAVLAVAAWVGNWICDTVDARRAPTPLTPEQLHDRGAPTYWADVFPLDAEGEAVR